MDCKEINDPDRLVEYFRMDDGPALTRVLNCFHDQFYTYVTGYFYNSVFSKWPVTKNKEDDLAKEAFSDGLQEFYFFIRKNGYENRKASVKTLFTTFCMNKLLRLATALKRQSAKYVDADPAVILEENPEVATKPVQALREYEDMMRNVWEQHTRAFARLDERCANLLIWRKVDRLSNEEIARRMKTLGENTVTNEVYKCFERLKKHLANIKNEQ